MAYVDAGGMPLDGLVVRGFRAAVTGVTSGGTDPEGRRPKGVSEAQGSMGV